MTATKKNTRKRPAKTTRAKVSQTKPRKKRAELTASATPHDTDALRWSHGGAWCHYRRAISTGNQPFRALNRCACKPPPQKGGRRRARAHSCGSQFRICHRTGRGISDEDAPHADRHHFCCRSTLLFSSAWMGLVPSESVYVWVLNLNLNLNLNLGCLQMLLSAFRSPSVLMF